MTGIGLIIGLIFAAIGFLVQMRLKKKFTEYSHISLASGLSGKQIAEKMLRDHNINGVQVISVEGFLSDHYNPLKKTINLSPEVYNGVNVAAAAVAAHETGHAIQHAQAYAFLKLRSALVPVVSFSSNIVMWVILAGVIMLQAFPQLLLIGIIMFAAITLFSFITLPVEFDASDRALVWLQGSRVTTQVEYPKAKNALWWAAMTYVVAALASLAQLIHYVMLYMSRRE